MWPVLLDMTKDESVQSLRCLELEAYSCLVSALRAQGSLSHEKLKLLRDAGMSLNISQDRHKAEVRRAVNDEKLNTIAYHASGQKLTSEEWAMEGRRVIPLMQRVVPQTAYSAIADEIADVSNKHNRQLPSPSSTERKRPLSTVSSSGVSDINRSITFRTAEITKVDDSKKRKLSVESSNLTPHLMGPPKMSRIQQIYRQKTKARQKEQTQVKSGKSEHELIQSNKVLSTQQIFQKVPASAQPTVSNINILQNITLPGSFDADEADRKHDSSDYLHSKDSDMLPSSHASIQNDNHQEKSIAIATTSKLSQANTLKTITTLSSKKQISTKCIAGQKLIVVSNPQSITTSSILQRTLTIPFVKNISVKNFDKFKIVTTNSSSTVQLTSLSSIAQNTSTKHKVVTVRTNPTVKKVIPLSQLQILNAKGGIKVLPIGGKVMTKNNSGSTPVYIVNSSNMQCLTKCTSSTPVIMTCKPQDSNDSKSLLVVKNSQILTADDDSGIDALTEPSPPFDKNVEGDKGNLNMTGSDAIDYPAKSEFENDVGRTVQQVECVRTEGGEQFFNCDSGGDVKELNSSMPCASKSDITYSNGLLPSIPSNAM